MKCGHLLQEEMMRMGFKKPLIIYCSMHTAVNIEKLISGSSGTDGFLSRPVYHFLTNIMMALGTR